MNIESGNEKTDIPAENEEVVGASENGIEIVEQRGEMLEGTMTRGRRAETTETFSTIGVVAEVAGGVVSEVTEASEVIEVIEIVEIVDIATTEDLQLNEPPNERRAQVLHQRRRSPHQI